MSLRKFPQASTATKEAERKQENGILSSLCMTCWITEENVKFRGKMP